MKKNLFIIGMLICLMSMFSCGKKDMVANGDNQEIQMNQNTQSNDSEIYDLKEGMEMPNVVVETNKDKTFDLSKTDKPVLINFWATWCPPCREEMPAIQELYEEYGSKVDFVLINAGENKEAIQDFLIENITYTFPIGYDEDDTYCMKFSIMAIPNTFIIGKDKIIKANLVVSRDKNQFKEYIEKVLNE